MDSQSIDLSNPFLMFEVDKVCATCTNHLLNGKSYSLGTVIDTTDYTNLFQVLRLQFQFKHEENGPSNLCSECYTKILLIYEFHQQYKKSVQLFYKSVEYQKQFTTLDDLDLGISATDAITTQENEEFDRKLIVESDKMYASESVFEKTEVEVVNLQEDESIENDRNSYNHSKLNCTGKFCGPNEAAVSKFLRNRNKSMVAEKKEDLKEDLNKEVQNCSSHSVKKKCVHKSKKSTSYSNSIKKKYPCSYCGRNLSNTTALARHEMIHTGERPHQCTICNYRTIARADLIKHKKKHMNKRPYACTECDKAYQELYSLTMHMQKHELPEGNEND